MTATTQLAPPEVSILLVDDEVRNLEALESFLVSPDYQLVRALTSGEALLQLLNREFAVIVLDIQMPEMSGIELANLIKQRKRTQHVPIIFLTAYYQEDKDVLEGYGIGAVDYLTKPVNPQILKSKIAVFVDLFRKTRALAETNAALEMQIWQRQNAEEALRRSNIELEERVRERTVDLIRVNEELSAREVALRASEAQLRLVTDHAPVFIVQLDRQHRFKFVNRTYARRFNFEPEQLIGKHFVDLMGEETYRSIRPHIDASLRGQRVEFETEMPYAGLGSRWVYVIHEAERAPSGEVVGIVAVVTDITERKLAEQSVASARDRALAASRAKDEFLAALSHELRTPLNPVLLLATEAAANPKLPTEVRADFEVIARNVMLEARLIDDLLDLTAIARGKLTLKKARFDVHETLREAVVMVRTELEQKAVELTLRLEAAPTELVGDDVRLKQVFWNVIKNAAKFTPAGGKVLVETTVDEGVLVISVTDTGIGMTTGELGRIFEAFSQGDHAVKGGAHRFGGLGLGLAISRMMVELHAGTIVAASEGRDRGTTVVIRLPLPNAAELIAGEPPFAVAAHHQSGHAASAEAKPRRILLVEDHKPTLRTLSQLLERRGFVVAAAGSLEEARRLAQDREFDLLISDIGLPDGSGCDLMSELRNRPGLVGIALTGYGMDTDIERSHAAGFFTQLTKPVSVQALDGVLLAVSGRSA